LTPSVAALLDPVDRRIDVGKGAACCGQQPSIDLDACAARLHVFGGGAELAELADSEVSLTLENAFRGSDELRGERARR
jgi:hypothetical protein